MNTTICFDTQAPSGRAIQHLLDTVLADHIGQGIDVRWRPTAAGTPAAGRTLVIHPSMPRDDNDTVGSLLMLVESLAGVGSVNFQHLYAQVDPDAREHIALAVFMAAGYDVGVPAGRRVAS